MSYFTQRWDLEADLTSKTPASLHDTMFLGRDLALPGTYAIDNAMSYAVGQDFADVTTYDRLLRLLDPSTTLEI
ncbi:hypothetical protein TWF481_008754 [Arthrobotrys musiformis]|uniref:Uncharacterized protein n=1 Tax=Arthrobotrys musiformis TaxID=47236 RepID=A0AAV9W921_9PEZI